MDDLLKGLAAGAAALILIHGSLEHHLQQDATRQVSEAFRGPGTVQVRIAPEGLFGIFGGDLRAVDVSGERLSVNTLPFALDPRAGADGSIHHLGLHLRKVTLSGLPVERFDADVPGLRFDIGRTMRRNAIVLSRAGTGHAEAKITTEGLRAFILNKYEQTLSDVLVWTQNKKLYILGRARLFGTPVPFVASCTLAPRDGRYVDLTGVTVQMNGVPMPPQNAAVMTAQFNPVLDIVNDLGLGGYLTMTQVEIGDGFVTIRGQATLPVAPTQTGKE
ncbi:MAG TPA: DUF2993 domain-containing protein [Chthonomonadaceae bacterium]|nr:DUF2993 domain-containing protein [Chthonomonadaceae bacterium]